ncbi:MAG: tail fiber domain-containing protein, partial [Bacteroidetes bacterium]|nr:tail fiber domain-containing protein [Bacteroidota bacterium]
MKKTLILACLFLMTAYVYAQVPQGINYQAVARDAEGNVMSNTTIGVQMKITDKDQSLAEYIETHKVRTDPFGMFSLSIGTGEVAEGEFENIGWDKGNKWLEVAIDVELDGTFEKIASTQLLAVPYAFHSTTSDRLVDDGITDSRADPNDWTNTGNSGTTPGTNFLGTTDNKDLVIKVNNTEVGRFVTEGRLGINNSSPDELIHITEDTNGVDARIKFTALSNSGVTRNGWIGFDAELNLIFFKNGSNKMGLNANGRFGINDLDPTERFAIRETDPGVGVKIKLSAIDAGGSNIKSAFIGLEPGDNVIYLQKGTEKLAMNASGDVGIGTTTPSYKLHVIGKLKSDGITETSDIRLKKNITDIEGSLDNVLSMRGVKYNWRVDEFKERKFESKTQIGLIAQEILPMYPELVDTDNEGYFSLRYAHMIPILVEAIKEQQQII